MPWYLPVLQINYIVMICKLTLPKLILFCCFLLTSCDVQKTENSNPFTIETTYLKKLIADWSDAHSSKDIGVLANLYADSILYYGTQTNKNTCIADKLLFFKKYPDFDQKIVGNIQHEKINSAAFKCSFVKRVTLNQQTKDYPSYLVFSKKQDSWKITTEGDAITDKNKTIPKDAKKGDFNGDGVLDYVRVVPPQLEDEDCKGECACELKFSDNSIPTIRIENCIGGEVDNLGDLNKNGSDEIGILPGWWQSCWRSYMVYTLKNKKWIFAVEPFITHCNQWEEGVNPIQIDHNKAGNVIIRYSEHTGEDIVTKTKSVPIK